MSINEETLITTYKKMFGLSNVDNTLDVNKVLSNAEIDELKNRLDLIGGTLTGTLFGTNATFTNDLTSNTSSTGITMVQLIELIQELQSKISLISTDVIITPSSKFPVKIPFSSSTIDQVNLGDKTPYFFFTGSFRPFGMTTIINNFAITWGINRNTVHRDVWINEWTVVTRVWYKGNIYRLDVKFGEKWDRWDNGINGYSNNGETFPSNPSDIFKNENIYVRINSVLTNFLNFEYGNMEVIGPNNFIDLQPYFKISPDVVVTTNAIGENVYGGIYIIISYDKTAITIKFCTSDGTIYYSAKTNFNPLSNDRRPFYIYNNYGTPVWYYGIVLIDKQGRDAIEDINMFKQQFSLLY
jgi:hypothetical protein